eukprot:gene3318-biopygen11967
MIAMERRLCILNLSVRLGLRRRSTKVMTVPSMMLVRIGVIIAILALASASDDSHNQVLPSGGREIAV